MGRPMAQDNFTAARHFTPLLLLALTAAMAPVPSSVAQCMDADLDGFFSEAGCGTALDCNDAAPTTNPGAVEVCDGYDTPTYRVICPPGVRVTRLAPG